LWKKEGKCENDPDFVAENCRYTCGICTRKGEQNPPEKVGFKPAAAVKKSPVEASIDDAGVDEKRAHRLFLSGEYPDSDVNTCSLLGTPNGQLMDVMRVEGTEALIGASNQ
jgi:hypothetical protein